MENSFQTKYKASVYSRSVKEDWIYNISDGYLKRDDLRFNYVKSEMIRNYFFVLEMQSIS